MRSALTLTAAAAIGIALGFTAGPAAHAKKSAGQKFDIDVSGPDIVDDSGAPVTNNYKVKLSGISGGTIGQVAYWFPGGTKRSKGKDHTLSAAFPMQDYSAVQLPFVFNAPGTSYGIGGFVGRTPVVLGYWSSNPQGATATVTVTSVTSKGRRLKGTLDLTLLDAATFLDLQPVHITGTFDVKLPKATGQ